jgi:outer membrane receptor for ferrienterochelin and colicins
MHMNKSCCLGAIVLAACVAAPAGAQTQPPDISELSLQQLLEVEITSTASKFPQQVTHAPASITIVTADEIRRYGHRTLSDVLRSVRGLYVSYDRNYSYLGVRGFGRPGDYNTCVLLLIDGHRLNDPIYDMGPLGTDLPLDLELIDRVEVIRGPGSALYGSNALFAVVNIITRTGRQEGGVHAQVEAGNLRTLRARVSAGREFGNGLDVVLAASRQDARGARQLYFPEFDRSETANGVAAGLDEDEAERLFGAISFGGFTLRGAYADRRKQVPTAAFDTVFGDPRFRTQDEYGIADLTYHGSLGHGWTGTARAAYDRYHYDGSYPYDYGGLGVHLQEDVAKADWTTGELTMSRRFRGRHFFTLGAEGRYSFRQEQYVADVLGMVPIDSRRSSTWGAYIQDEWSATESLVLSAGLRLDHAATWGSEVSPRGALVYSPTAGTSLKVMHGRSFRAPNVYELHYFASQMGMASFNLTPEKIQTTEGAWEQYYGRRVRSTVSVFYSDISDLISQTASPDDASQLMFANVSGAHSGGVEAEVEARWPGGLVTRVSHAFTKAHNADTEEPLTNSPAHLSKAGVIVPLAGSRAFLGLESLYTSERRSLRGQDLGSFFLQNASLTTERLIPGADLRFSVQNLFDQEYADPGAEEHVQAGIPQDGRTFRVQLGVRF